MFERILKQLRERNKSWPKSMAKQNNKGKGDKLVCDICGKGGALLRHGSV